MGMIWNTIKRGFGYGFGGRIGWELGGLIWKWVSRLMMLVVVGITGQCAAHNYTDGAAKAKVQQAQAAKDKSRQREAKHRAKQQEERVPNPVTMDPTEDTH